MKKLFAVMTSLLLIAGCSTNQSSSETLTFNQQIQNSLQKNEEVITIKNPNLTLPSDIHPDQIKLYFQGGDTLFALVQDAHRDVNFKGVLIANKNDKTWTKYVEIKDAKSPSTGNNPYYLWKTDQDLSLSIVDKNGGGSGEGFMKTFTFNKSKWEQTGCYYYGPGPNNENFGSDCATEEECFALSKNLDKYRAITSANSEEYTYCQVEFIPMEPKLN